MFKPKTLSFSIETTPRMANAIRRYILERVEVLAIDKVVIYENHTAHFDEYIAHRVGQIPLTMPEKEVDETKVGFYLDEVGPKVVTSSDLHSNSEDVKVAIEDIPIVTLQKDQSIRFEGYVKKGIARDHAKFQAAVVSYEEKNGTYNFFVEPIGQMPAKRVAKAALEALLKDLKSLKGSLKAM